MELGSMAPKIREMEREQRGNNVETSKDEEMERRKKIVWCVGTVELRYSAQRAAARRRVTPRRVAMSTRLVARAQVTTEQ